MQEYASLHFVANACRRPHPGTGGSEEIRTGRSMVAALAQMLRACCLSLAQHARAEEEAHASRILWLVCLEGSNSSVARVGGRPDELCRDLHAWVQLQIWH